MSKLTPFNQFVRNVRNARAQDYLSRPGSRIADARAFEEMRRYVLSLYRGVHVSHSYAVDSIVLDCVPLNEQPGLRGVPRNFQATGCPDRTIPMRRITLEQLSNFRTLREFLSKP